MGANHPDVATSYHNLGLIFDSKGNYERSIEFHEKSLKIRLISLGENHLSVATSKNNLR